MALQPEARELIDRLGLSRHPEGGWYRETYRSAESVPAAALPPRFGGERSFCTTIYYLLEPGDFSSLHRIRSDELWHFHAGSPLTVQILQPDGLYRSFVLGPDLRAGETFQGVVPAGCWFGAEPAGEGYSLVGCTVAPGFDFADFELADREALLSLYPDQAGLVRRLTR